MYRILYLLFPVFLLPVLLLAAPPQVTVEENQALEQSRQLADQAAIDLLKQYVSEIGSGAIDFELGVRHLASDQPQQAVRYFELALAKAPTFAEARYNYGLALLQSDQPAAAAEQLRQAVRLPEVPAASAWLALGTAYHRLGHLAASEEAFRQALVHDPENHALRRAVLKLALDQGDLSRAAELARRELAANPSQPDLWLIKAQAALDADQPQAAINALEIARRLGMNQPETLLTLGDLYLAEGLYRQASEVYRQIATGAPTSPGLVPAISRLLDAGQLDAANRLLQALPSELRQAMETRRLRAKLAARQDRPQDALALYRELLNEQPTDGELLLETALLLPPEEAKPMLQRAINASPAHRLQAHVQLAQLAVAAKAYAQAVEHLEAALAIERRPSLQRYLDDLRGYLAQ